MNFLIEGKALSQKNDVVIRKAKGGRYFVGHSQKLSKVRDQISKDVFQQYLDQGYSDPIDYLCEFSFKFYCLRQHEPDVDNLAQIFLDALQGIKNKKEGTVEYQVLKNDKLVRVIRCEKIVLGDLDYNGEPRTEFEIKEYQK